MTKSHIAIARGVQMFALGLCLYWFYEQGGFEPIVTAVLVLAAFLVPLATIGENKKPELIQEPQLPDEKDATPSGISFDSIWEAIDRAPPFQKSDIGEQYVGIKVRWRLYLFSAERVQGDLVELCLTEQTSFMRGASCTVDLRECREIAVLPRGTPVEVSGKIEKVGAMIVRLTNASVALF